MIESERIYIQPKRTRLGLDRPNYQWRHLGIFCLIGCAITAAIWWML